MEIKLADIYTMSDKELRSAILDMQTGINLLLDPAYPMSAVQGQYKDIAYIIRKLSGGIKAVAYHKGSVVASIVYGF
jgi:hypothetical protein